MNSLAIDRLTGLSQTEFRTVGESGIQVAAQLWGRIVTEDRVIEVVCQQSPGQSTLAETSHP